MRINDKAAFDKENIFGLGNANTAYAQYFIGNSYLNPLTETGKCAVFLANVTFEPGCRNNWHIHHANSGGRPAVDLHRWRRLVSGGGKGSRQPYSWYGHHYSSQCQALAWGEERQLVQPHRRRSTRRRNLQRVAGSCGRRNL